MSQTKRKILEKISPVSVSLYKSLFELEGLASANKHEGIIERFKRSIGL